MRQPSQDDSTQNSFRSPAAYRPWLHYYSVLLSACTFLLLFAGGMVTSTNSGLAVPDWPTTFGHNMFLFPPSMMKGGIFYEHGHRLFASLVGLLTVGLCLAFWVVERRRALQWVGTFSLFLVMVQGTLGGITVRYKLPIAVSTAHACTAELFFALTILMAFATSKTWLNSKPNSFSLAAPGQALALLFSACVFLQILVGAIMRHSSAGLAIPTFPKAFGEWVPPFWNFGILMHFFHSRVGAASLLVIGIALILRILTDARFPKAIRKLSIFLGAALALQCLLGMLTIWTGKAPIPASVHLSGGALVFGASILLTLYIYRWNGAAGVTRNSPEARRTHALTAGKAASA